MRISFNINRLIEEYLPELERKPKHLAWLGSVFKPLATLWTAVLTYRTAKLYEATITGETNRLEKALQDRYGDAGILIIQPTDYLDSAWIFMRNEPHFQEYDFLKAEAHEPVEYDFLASEYDPDYDFIVRVPPALASVVPDLKNWMKKYVMAGKRFNVELY